MTSAQSPEPQARLILQQQGSLDVIISPNFSNDKTKTKEVVWIRSTAS